MGMYDNVKVDLETLKGEFQSKDLDCNLSNYLIDKQGIQILKNSAYYRVPWISERIHFYRFNLETKSLAEYYADFENGNLIRYGEMI